MVCTQPHMCFAVTCECVTISEGTIMTYCAIGSSVSSAYSCTDTPSLRKQFIWLICTRSILGSGKAVRRHYVPKKTYRYAEGVPQEGPVRCRSTGARSAVPEREENKIRGPNVRVRKEELADPRREEHGAEVLVPDAALLLDGLCRDHARDPVAHAAKGGRKASP